MKGDFPWSDWMNAKRLVSLKEWLYLPKSIGWHVLGAAKGGRTLPRLSLVLLLQLCLHIVCDFKQLSLALLIVSSALNVVGYALLIALYRCSLRTIFNRQIPPTMHECLASFGAHLSMLRPLEILFRYYTSSWRVLPDIIVLGEVRCGTTSLCQHLADLDCFACHTPFCLWAHPELDNKETFYFVGHYLGTPSPHCFFSVSSFIIMIHNRCLSIMSTGNVTPRHYRMCFPLKLTKWWNDFLNRIRGKQPKPFLSFGMFSMCSKMMMTSFNVISHGTTTYNPLLQMDAHSTLPVRRHRT